MTTHSTPGSDLRALRRRVGFGQQQLAERSGVSIRTIRGLETGAITAPHASTLIALGNALGLTPPSCDRLVQVWTRSPMVVAADKIIFSAHKPSGDFKEVLAERQRRDVGSMRTITSMVRVSVGADRRFEWIHRYLVQEALRDGDGTHLYTSMGDSASDVRLTRIDQTVGCELLERIDDIDGNMSAFEFSLGGPVRRGELRSFSYRELQAAPEAEDPGLRAIRDRLGVTDGYSTAWRVSLAELSLQIQFRGGRPATVWEIVGTGGGWERLREVQPDEFGSVHLFYRNLDPGSRGFEWTWSAPTSVC